MAGKKGHEGPQPTILKNYQDHRGNQIFHDPRHARCHGTGYLIESYVITVDEVEEWRHRAWDCSCRNELGTRADFDRGNPALRGMTQDQLDQEAYRVRYTDEEKAAHEGILSRILAHDPNRRIGAIMGVLRPVKAVPQATVTDEIAV